MENSCSIALTSRRVCLCLWYAAVGCWKYIFIIRLNALSPISLAVSLVVVVAASGRKFGSRSEATSSTHKRCRCEWSLIWLVWRETMGGGAIERMCTCALRLLEVDKRRPGCDGQYFHFSLDEKKSYFEIVCTRNIEVSRKSYRVCILSSSMSICSFR